MKQVQRRTPGGTLHPNAAHTDTSANDATADSDRIDAWLDIYSERTGAHADAIRAEVLRVHGTAARITRELIKDAAERLAFPGSFVADNAAAQYHRPTQQDVAAARINTDDRAFRAMLASRLGDEEGE